MSPFNLFRHTYDDAEYLTSVFPIHISFYILFTYLGKIFKKIFFSGLPKLSNWPQFVKWTSSSLII